MKRDQVNAQVRNALADGLGRAPGSATDTDQPHVETVYGDAAEAVLILEALAAAMQARAGIAPGYSADIANEIEKVAKSLAEQLGPRLAADRPHLGRDWDTDLDGALPR